MATAAVTAGDLLQLLTTYNQQINKKVMEILEIQQAFMTDIYSKLPNSEGAQVALPTQTQKERKQRDRIPHSCTNCGDTSPANFYKGRRSKCKACHSTEMTARIKESGKHEMGIERNNREKMSRKKCTDCPLEISEDNKAMFEWDHRDPSEKAYKIAAMTCMSDKDYHAELAKCDLVCKECHSKRTRSQREQNKIRSKPRKYNVGE